MIADGHGPPRPLRAGRAPVWSLVFGPDDDTLIAGSIDGKVRLWRLRERAVDPVRTFDHGDGVEMVACSHDGTYIAATGPRRSPEIWLASDPSRRWTLPVNGPMTVAFDPLNDAVVTGTTAGIVSVWSDWKEHPTEVARFTNNSFILEARFTNDGRGLVILPVAGGGRKYIWRTEELLAIACKRLDPFSVDLKEYHEVCATNPSNVKAQLAARKPVRLRLDRD